ncbi:MAG: hypothetical protein V1816_18230 [Pseudomonadota bacterium]
MNKKKFLSGLLLIVLVAVFSSACDYSSGSDGQATANLPFPANLDGLKSEAGYSELESISFSFQQVGSIPILGNSSRARVFYSYHPADAASADLAGETAADGNGKPLFVFLNGGPGCATATNLFSMNTAPYTLDRLRVLPGGNSYEKNPYSWTQLGNLLYIDAPNTGFSYNLVKHADWAVVRAMEFSADNFNPFIDAAQVLRVVLRFLRDHPGIQQNQVVFVGESYSGTRVTTMLNLLLFFQKYADGSRIYQDEALAGEIKDHLKETLPNGAAMTPQNIAIQFGRQVLIEPQLTGPYQDEVTAELFLKPGSVIDEIAAETNTPWNRRCREFGYTTAACITNIFIAKSCKRDPYIYTRPNTWSDDLEAFAMQNLLDVDILSTILNYDVNTIDALKPEARKKEAYRYHPWLGPTAATTEFYASYPEYEENMNLDEQIRLEAMEESTQRVELGLTKDAVNGMREKFGPLQSWDDYLVGTNRGIYAAFMFNRATMEGYDINQDRSTLFGWMFLHNLAVIDTFLTDAELDLIIYSPALPLSFAKYDKIASQVQTVRENEDLPGSGYVTIYYHENSLVDIDAPTSRTIRYPYYETSGHSVSSTQPDKFLDDVKNWMAN